MQGCCATSHRRQQDQTLQTSSTSHDTSCIGKCPCCRRSGLRLNQTPRSCRLHSAIKPTTLIHVSGRKDLVAQLLKAAVSGQPAIHCPRTTCDAGPFAPGELFNHLSFNHSKSHICKVPRDDGTECRYQLERGDISQHMETTSCNLDSCAPADLADHLIKVHHLPLAGNAPGTRAVLAVIDGDCTKLKLSKGSCNALNATLQDINPMSLEALEKRTLKELRTNAKTFRVQPYGNGAGLPKPLKQLANEIYEAHKSTASGDEVASLSFKTHKELPRNREVQRHLAARNREVQRHLAARVR